MPIHIHIYAYSISITFGITKGRDSITHSAGPITHSAGPARPFPSLVSYYNDFNYF